MRKKEPTRALLGAISRWGWAAHMPAGTACLAPDEPSARRA